MDKKLTTEECLAILNDPDKLHQEDPFIESLLIN